MADATLAMSEHSTPRVVVVAGVTHRRRHTVVDSNGFETVFREFTTFAPRDTCPSEITIEDM